MVDRSGRLGHWRRLRSLSSFFPSCRIYASRLWSRKLRVHLHARPGFRRLLSGFCSSVRGFASRFFQPRPRGRAPCGSLGVPATWFPRGLSPPSHAHAGHTDRGMFASLPSPLSRLRLESKADGARVQAAQCPRLCQQFPSAGPRRRAMVLPPPKGSAESARKSTSRSECREFRRDVHALSTPAPAAATWTNEAY
jgi:hypothetical protein